ncbi:MAG: hypothetical protein AAFQ89_18355 [Cyanobacteria bacterium J06626_18]
MRSQIFLLATLAMTLTTPTSAQMNTLDTPESGEGVLPASVMQPDFHVLTDPTIHAGASPEAVMSQVFAGATEATQVLVLSQSGPYAVALYQWGHGCGFVVMELEPDAAQWSDICAGGGALAGAAALSDCGLPLANAESLWNQLVQASEVVGYVL